MNGSYSVMKLIAFCVSMSFVFTLSSTRAQQPSVDVLGPVHAKGIIIVRVALPAAESGALITPWISGGDGELIEAKAQFPHGEPFHVKRKLGKNGSHVAVLLTPLVALFDENSRRFLFDEPGKYDLKWEVAYQGTDQKPLTLAQRIQVIAPRPSDLAFLRQAGDVGFLRTLYAKDLFEEADPDFRDWARGSSATDYRALIVVTELLEATRAKEPGDVAGARGRSIEDALRWADALSKLALAHPDSSYSPYARYFAGCCYLLGVARENKEGGWPTSPDLGD
jgi:hypothetical protein